MSPLLEKSANELAGLVRSTALSPVDLMEETLRRVEAVNPTLNAFVALCFEQALEEAEDLAERVAQGQDPGPLAGVPLGVKDLEAVAGMVTSFGSVPYRDHVARRDSVQVARLRAVGAIVIGKTNTPEFGSTGFTKNRLFGVTRNPWNRDRTPGGSSGGSAGAVAGRMVPLATGSDAGGSVRIPASYCGCFGLKPSFGRIPRGPAPLLYTYPLWCPGPLTMTVEDAALYLDCVAGHHAWDPESLPHAGRSFQETLEEVPAGLRIAFSPTLGYARVQREVLARVEEAVKAFEDMGHRIEPWEGNLPDVGEAWTTLMNCELFGQLHRELEQHRRELGKALVKSLDQARSLTPEDHIAAQAARTELNRRLKTVFERFDLLLTPTMPTEAFAAEGPPPSEIEGHPIPLLGAVAFTYPFNLSGHPAASVPAGFTQSGLPVGLQIVGPRHRDDLVLQASRAYEQARPWRHHRPELHLEEGKAKSTLKSVTQLMESPKGQPKLRKKRTIK